MLNFSRARTDQGGVVRCAISAAGFSGSQFDDWAYPKAWRRTGFAHAAAVELLPNYHTDPFDRMIIAQSKVEKLVVVSHDRAMEPYGIPVIWT